MNGWSYRYEDNKSAELRRNIVIKHSADVYGLCETHLRDNDVITVSGFKWIGQNRTNISENALRGSGGVGFLISDKLLTDYNYDVIDDTYEGILWIKLSLKHDPETSVLLCVCYLPPEGSSRGNQVQEFYDTLLAQVYLHWDGSPTLICGDFNGRIGTKQDSCDETIRPRVAIDAVHKNHGEHLLQFLSDTRFCTANGRFDIQRDNYTSISQKGRAVVDFIIVPGAQLNNISDFHVTTMTDALDLYGITPHSRAKVPDHSLLTCTMDIHGYSAIGRHMSSTATTATRGCHVEANESVHRRYRVNPLPSDIFTNQRCTQILVSIIDSLQAAHMEQNALDSLYESFLKSVHTEMDNELDYKDYTPHTSKRKRSYKPYWNADLKSQWTAVRDSERAYLACRGANRNRRRFHEIFKVQRDGFDKNLRRAERQYNSQQRDRIHELRTHNPRQFWQELNNIGPGSQRQEGITGVLLEDGSISYDPTVILQKWKRDFEGLYSVSHTGSDHEEFMEEVQRLSAQWEREYEAATSMTPEAQQEEYHVQADENTDRIRQAARMLNCPITLQEVINTLSTTRDGKAVGIDNVANEILKVPALQVFLHELYSACFRLNRIPSLWYKSMIHPILKKGKSPLIPLDHRGISLMSTVAKAFSAILNKRLAEYLEIHNIYVDEQNGFRRLRSCLDHLYTLTTIVRNRKQRGLPTYCCFVDFAKAFDSVNYPCLWHKLLAYGIHGPLLHTIQTLYANLQSCVRINGMLTDWFGQDTGVRQGDTLAPTLFALYINDLALEVNLLDKGVPIGDQDMVSILLYADDVVLLSETEEGLQDMLNTLHGWSRDWMLGINYSKTKVMHFRRATDEPTDTEFHIGDTALEKTNSYRYLGLDLEETLNYSHGATILNRSASRALGAVISKYFTMDGTTHDTYRHMYDSLVAPVMDYSAEIWGTKSYDCFNTTQNRAMRTFLGVPKCTPLPAIYGDMQWTTPHTRHQVAAVRYWIRLTHLPRSRITRRVFDWDHALALNGRRCWNKDIRDILVQAGYEDIFNTASTEGISDQRILNNVRTKASQRCHEQRLQAAASMSRMVVYNATKTTYGTTEPYVASRIINRQQRSALGRLRGGTLPLAIETGRYRQIPQNDRICKSCDSQNIENEYHFILDCARHKDLRDHLLYYDNNQSNESNVSDIFGDILRTKTLAEYIIRALKERTK